MAVVCFAHSDRKKLMKKMRAEGFCPVLLHEVDAHRHLVPDRILQVILQRDVACIAVPREERLGAERFLERWEAEQTERVGAISRNLGAGFLKSVVIAALAGVFLSFLGMGAGAAALFSLLVWAGAFVLLVPGEKRDEEESAGEEDVAADGTAIVDGRECPGCRELNDPDAEFCDYCGYRFAAKTGGTNSKET